MQERTRIAVLGVGVKLLAEISILVSIPSGEFRDLHQTMKSVHSLDCQSKLFLEWLDEKLAWAPQMVSSSFLLLIVRETPGALTVSGRQ